MPIFRTIIKHDTLATARSAFMEVFMDEVEVISEVSVGTTVKMRKRIENL